MRNEIKKKLLVITHIYPNHLEPTGGLFNSYQVRELAKDYSIKVIAPLPWFPGLWLFGRRAEFYYSGRVKKFEVIDEVEVYHPLFISIPKIGRCLQVIFYFLSAWGVVKQINKRFRADLVISMYAYPDACAADWIASIMGKPHIAKVLGSDINLIAKTTIRGSLIKAALQKSKKIVSMSEDLNKKVVELGIPSSKTVVLYNGVDKNIFFLKTQAVCRAKLDIKASTRVILFVGNLKEIKGIEYLIDSFESMQGSIPELKLYLIGQGPREFYYKNIVTQKKLQNSISFLGAKGPAEISSWMSAADVLCLPSLNEGLPNVILESLSCGTPVVATRIGGIPEVVHSSEIGLLIEPKNSVLLADALIKALGKKWDRQFISDYGRKFSWEENARIFKGVIEEISAEC
jgi:glycosyltransferase involved in cell wall biosynthesis